MRVFPVPTENLEKAWASAEKWILQAKEKANGIIPISDVYKDIVLKKKALYRCVEGKKFCWLIITIYQNSENRTCNIDYCAGNGALDMLSDLVLFCEAYAVSMECEYITMTGRKGWGKVLNKHDWKERNITFGKELM